MNYINYKKNTLNKLKVSDINMPIPNLKNENKTLIIISCCSANKKLMNNDHYNELKEIADLMILTDR